MSKTKATFNLDSDLHQQLKIQAATERRDMVEIVAEAIRFYLIAKKARVTSTSVRRRKHRRLY